MYVFVSVLECVYVCGSALVCKSGLENVCVNVCICEYTSLYVYLRECVYECGNVCRLFVSISVYVLKKCV